MSVASYFDDFFYHRLCARVLHVFMPALPMFHRLW